MNSFLKIFPALIDLHFILMEINVEKLYFFEISGRGLVTTNVDADHVAVFVTDDVDTLGFERNSIVNRNINACVSHILPLEHGRNDDKANSSADVLWLCSTYLPKVGCGFRLQKVVLS